MSEQGYKDFVKRLTDVCEKYSDKTAITYMRNDGSKTLFTFGEIFKQIKAAKEKFEKIGLQKGDRVAIIAPLSPFSVFTLFSLAYANITAVLIDASLPPQEIDRLLTYSDVRSVFTVPAIFEALDETVCNDIPVFDLTKEDGEYQLFPNAPDKVSRPPTTDPGMDVFVMIFSSGTTSEMKGIMHTYTAILSGLELNWKIADVSHESMYLHILPISHLAGLDCILTFFFCGSNIGMVEEMTAAKLPTSLTNYKPTHFVVVPRVFEVIEQKIRQEVRSKGALVSGVFSLLLGVSHFFRKKLGLNVGKVLCKSIRKKVFGENIFAIGAGGAIAKGSMVSFFLDLGVKIWADFYALSETGVPTVATGAFDRYPAGTQGNVNRFDGIKIKIHAPDESGVGEVRIKTNMIMKGYFRDPEATAAAFDEDGYFKTGDLGYIDKKNYLHVTGRIKEAIIMHTGKKVAPIDVDNFYSRLLGDIVFASCGVPNKNGTYDEIHLFIEKGDMSETEQHELRDNIMDLSGNTNTLYQLSGLHFIDTIPMTSIKKVKRFQLKELALAEYNN